MCVTIEPAGDRDTLDIVIRGPGAHDLFDPKIDLDLYPRCTVVCAGDPHGQLLEADSDMWGRVYCRRLFVGCDPLLRDLKLGANLHLPVARDRHLVPNDTWPTIQLILQSAVAAHRARPQALARDAPALQHLLALLGSGTEAEFQKQMPFVKPALRSFCAVERGVAEASLVFLLHPTEEYQAVLSTWIGLRASLSTKLWPWRRRSCPHSPQSAYWLSKSWRLRWGCRCASPRCSSW